MLRKNTSLPDFIIEEKETKTKEKIKRETNAPHMIINGKETLSKPFLEKHNAQGVIRIQKKDYLHIPKDFFTHFNLQHCSHKVGNIYLLPKITEQGYYKSENDEKLPNLDFENCLIGKCIEVKEHLSYSDLKEEDFRYSLSNIKNTAQLKNEIIFRYSKSLPNYSEKQLIDLGISLTKLQIIGKLETPKQQSKKCYIDTIDKTKCEATREGFGKGMLELGKNKNVVALTADLTGSVLLNKFKEQYPKRFFQFGIAEQNMLSAAAGMTIIDKIPFVTSFAAFNPGRNWDQLRVSVCYQNSNVKIFGSHAGLTTGPDGATHQALEDVAITRVLPNLTVIVPCDSEEMRKATIAAAKHIGPVYLRGSRAKTPIITNLKTKFEIGIANILDEGCDLTIIACGVCVQFALEAKKQLLKEGIDAAVIDCHTIKPLDEKTILKYAKLTNAIITIEEHQKAGGLGSAVAELLSQNYPVPIEIIGTNNTFGESGEDKELLEKYNISTKEIIKKAKKIMKRK